MASTSDSWGSFDAINLKLFNYLLKNVTTSETPVKIRWLCREFMETVDASCTLEQLQHRVQVIRLKVHDLKDLDLETKVRLSFGLSVSVDEYFLKEVRESGDVTLEVDDRNRITKYEKKGGLKLAGFHSTMGYRGVTDDDREIQRKMMDMLVEKTRHPTAAPIVTNRFLIEFKEQHGDTTGMSRLLKRLNHVRSNIYASTEYDMQHRIRMLFVSGAKIPERVLKELQVGATVCLDSESRIIEYIADDKSLKLIGDHNAYKKKDGGRKSSGVADEFEMEEDYLEDDEDDSRDVPSRKSALKKRGHQEEFGSTNAKRATPTGRPDEPSTSSNPVRQLTNFVNGIQVRSVYEELEGADDELVNDHSLPALSMRRQMLRESYDMSVDIKAEQHRRTRDQMFGYIKRSNDSNVPEINESKQSTSQSNEAHDEESTSTRKVLGALRGLVCTLDSPLLEHLQQNIETAIEDRESEEKKVPLDALTMVVQSSLVIANISASEVVPLEDSENLREFLRLYQCALCSLDSKSFNEMHKMFKDSVAKLKTSNKRITMKKIRAVLDSVLALVV